MPPNVQLLRHMNVAMTKFTLKQVDAWACAVCRPIAENGAIVE